METLSLKKYIHHKTRSSRVGIPLLCALMVSLVVFYTILLYYSNFDRTFAGTISPHISTLVEAQDGPEIKRLIQSIQSQSGSHIQIVKNGMVVASTLASKHTGEGMPLLNIPSKVSWEYLISRSPIVRKGGPENTNAEMIILTPVSIVFIVSAIAALGVFIFIFSLISLVAKKTISAAHEIIAPVGELNKAIKNLKLMDETIKIPSFKILELENIRSSIVSTQSQLAESNKKLAEGRAKILSIKAYKNLIHDLHTPVAALKQHVKIFKREDIDEEVRKKSIERTMVLSEQVLNQVTASRGYLTLDIKPTNTEDMRKCVEDATIQAETALSEKFGVEVKKVFPKKSINVKHDPIMLGRAITNLVVNAIEACKNIVEVQFMASSQGICIAVSDDGPGIEREEVGQYLQGRKVSTKKSGVGIGLSGANHIVKIHGGKIVYKPSIYGGACFEVRI